MPLLDTRPDHLKIVQDILQKFVPEREVWVFGSRAKWLAKEYSDLDLCIVGEKPLNFRTQSLLEDAFEDSDLPYKVDVVDWATTSESFRKIIERDRVVVQRAAVGRVSAKRVTRQEPDAVASGDALVPEDVGLRCANPTYGAARQLSGRVAQPGADCGLVGGVGVGVGWVGGGMSAQWQLKTIGEFCPFKYGKALPERDRKPGQYGVFSSAGLVGSHEAAYVHSSGVVIGRKGTVGSVSYSAAPFWPIDTAFYIENQPEVRDIRFTYYLLKTLDLHLMNTDSAVPGLNRDNAHAVEIFVPPLSIQKTIADFLLQIDDRITLLRETNATLEAIAQALFKSWFVDFDPVRAKLESRAPEGMDEATAALFPDSFEESELGLVPRGWRVGTVGDFARQYKGSINPLQNPEVMFEHFSLPAFDNQQMPVLELGTEIKSNKTTVPPDAVLLSKLNPHIPRIWLPVDVGNHAVCSTEFLVFVPATSSNASKEFIYCAFTTAKFKELLCQLVTGTSNSHQRVKPDGVSTMCAVIPNNAALKEFGSIVKPIFERIGHNRGKAQTLATLRDTLLPRLISGQLRLPESVPVLEAALA